MHATGATNQQGACPRPQAYESLQLQAYDRIRRRILYADYVPGDKLMVRDLCADLDMGRTPIRESLARLGQEGLVQIIPQSGTYVNRISLCSVKCARYVRANLERNRGGVLRQDHGRDIQAPRRRHQARAVRPGEARPTRVL